MTLQIETRLQAAERLALQDAQRRDATGQHKVIQQAAADALLGTVEHVTLWTEPNGRPRHDSRMERTS